MPTACRARTERCSSLRSSRSVYRPTHSPRCGRRSGLVQLVGDEPVVADIGSRLTYSRVSPCCAAPTPDIFPPPNPRIRLFGHSHCALHLNPAEKVLYACGLWLGTDGVCGSAYGSLRCNRVSACCAAPTPDWLFTASAQCSVKPVPQRLCRAIWHTLHRQSAGSSFPFPASPMLSLRSGLSAA